MDMFKGMLSELCVSKLRELGWKIMWGSGDAMMDHSYGEGLNLLMDIIW